MAKRGTPTISPTHRQAVTFIELLVIVVIIGFLASLAVPNFRKTFDNLELENYSRDIYYLDRFLREASAASANVHCLNIDLDKGEIRATSRHGAEFQPVSGRLGRIYKAPAGATIAVEPPDKTNVYFYPDASADNAKILFENKHKKRITLAIQGANSAIQIQ
jgi:Tfp pilus assembly protein FimT